MKAEVFDPEESTGPPPSKRIKTENAPSKRLRYTLADPLNLILHTIIKDDVDVSYKDMVEEAAKELKTSMGGKIGQLTVSGLVNGISGVQGGLITDRIWTSTVTDNQEIPTAQNATLRQLKEIASALHLAIEAKMETDALITTPWRIQDMLAPELLLHEFKSIRKRIHDTVILGKGGTFTCCHHSDASL
jgi:hypothetical protein